MKLRNFDIQMAVHFLYIDPKKNNFVNFKLLSLMNNESNELMLYKSNILEKYNFSNVIYDKRSSFENQ